MRTIGLLVVAILTSSCVTKDKPSPLGDLSDVTRIEASSGGQPAHTFQLPADSLRIAMISEAVSSHQSGWQRTWHTLPAGDIAVSFIRDTTLVGVVWLGSEFLAARGTGETLLMNITRADEIRLRALLNPATVLSTISNETPKPPQN
jgi:hypothetical protein